MRVDLRAIRSRWSAAFHGQVDEAIGAELVAEAFLVARTFGPLVEGATRKLVDAAQTGNARLGDAVADIHALLCAVGERDRLLAGQRKDIEHLCGEVERLRLELAAAHQLLGVSRSLHRDVLIESARLRRAIEARR